MLPSFGSQQFPAISCQTVGRQVSKCKKIWWVLADDFRTFLLSAPSKTGPEVMAYC
jgi:hypothetical protein